MLRRVARYQDDPDPKAELLAALHIFWQGARRPGDRPERADGPAPGRFLRPLPPEAGKSVF